jgi:hypothetical protein
MYIITSCLAAVFAAAAASAQAPLPAEVDQAIAILGSHAEIEGGAMFRAFESVIDVVNSEFARVEPAE